MQISVLGPLGVSSEDGVLDLGAPAQRALLAVLLTSPNRPVSDDRLLDELWGDAAPPSAHHLLQVYASRLRALLRTPGDGQRISHGVAGYTLQIEPGELDADSFVRAIAQARELADSDSQAAEAALATAMHLWRGAPFADLVEVPPVVLREVERLVRLHREAQELLVEIRLRLGQHRALVPELLDLVIREPYDEALHAHLMLALYRSGRQAEALEISRALRARLREELGIDPGPEVERLYRRILLQDPTLLLAPVEPPSNLPTRATSFVGRRSELRDVTELLRTHRLVILTGPGGIGKTRLAIEVADRQRAQYPGGVVWVDLAHVTDPDRVLEELAAVLNVSAAPGASLLAAVGRSISRRPPLLLIDNCEHVAGAVSYVVAGILSATRGPRVLATSRTPLLVEGERLWTVPPLGLPDEASPLARVAESDAVRLFVERGRAADPSFNLDADNVAFVADVCRRLDGLSLAIEIAAARLADLNPREISGHLDRRFELLGPTALANRGRHQTMEATIDASHALLTEEERRVFERLSVFSGTFDISAAAAVGFEGGASPRHVSAIVSALVRASMLTTNSEGEHTRYRQLQILRDYGLVRLRARGEEPQTRRAHAEYFLGACEQAGKFVDTPDFASWADRLVAQYDDITAALGWSLAHHKGAHTLRAARALRELWYRTGQAQEAARWSSRMLDADLKSPPPAALAEVYNAIGFAMDLALDLDAAADAADQAIRLSREAGSRSGEAFALFGRANIALARGDFEAVRRFALDAIAACDRTTDGLSRARPLSLLGYAALFGGSPGEARAMFEEALALHRELADQGSVVIMALVPLVDATLGMNDLEMAEAYAADALEVGTNTRWEAAALVKYASVLAALGDVAAAETAATRGLRVALDGGLVMWVQTAILELARTKAEKDRCSEAARLWGALRQESLRLVVDRTVYGKIEARCRERLGYEPFDLLAAQGARMTDVELEELAGVR